MRAATWSLLFIAITVALAAQPEGEPDLGEAAGVRGDGDVDPSDLPPPKPLKLKAVDVQGLQVIDEYRAQNQRLIKQEKTLRQKLNSPPESLQGLAYVAIKGYKYSYQGRTIEDKSRAECELVCSTYSACKSYSYNARKRSCIWSMSHVVYDPNFTMWSKLLTPDGHFHTHLYTELPGMVVQEKRTPPIQDMTFAECKYECSKDESCKSFSFAKSKGECVKSSVPIDYNDEWTYYEKDVPIAKSKKNLHKKENDRKKKLKLAWIKASTASTRHEVEKQTKLTQKLEHARLVAEDMERSEKQARREMNFNQRKCVLLSGMSQGAMKRNMHMMGIMSDRQLVAVKQSSESEKMNKSVKQQTRKEALQKAKLDAKLSQAKMEERDDKVRDMKKMEHETKLVFKKGKERAEKACDKDKESQTYFAGRESSMKASEAEAKSLQMKKDIVFATDEYKKAAQFAEVKATAEKSTKKSVEMQKNLIESTEKREQKAERERDRKVANDEKEQYENKLHVASNEERRARHKNMKAMEKVKKAKANRDDLLARAKADQKLVKEREKEAMEKAEQRKADKKTHIKEKAEKKEQAAKAAKKSAELSQKRVFAQQAAVQEAMETMQDDARQAQSDMAKKEADEQRVTTSEESGAKADKKRTAALNEVVVQEVATKKKVSEEHARSQNLLQELKNAKIEADEAAAREAFSAGEAAKAKVEQERIADQERKANDPAKRSELASKEKQLKEHEISTARKADHSAAEKTNTALAQQEQASNLEATSCIAVCMEGTQLQAHNKQIEKEEKLRAMNAKNGADQQELGAETPVELGNYSPGFDSPVSLLQITDSETGCDPTGISAASGGACGGTITAEMLSGACPTGGACEGICTQKAATIQDQEASCKTNIQNPLEAQVENAPIPSEDSRPVSEQDRGIMASGEKATKEKKVKVAETAPVPEHLEMPFHEPFTYKGCEC